MITWIHKIIFVIILCHHTTRVIIFYSYYYRPVANKEGILSVKLEKAALHENLDIWYNQQSLLPDTGLALLWFTAMRCALGDDRAPWLVCRCWLPAVKRLGSLTIGWPGIPAGIPAVILWPTPAEKRALLCPEPRAGLLVVVVVTVVVVREWEIPVLELLRFGGGDAPSWETWLVNVGCSGWDWLREELGDWLTGWAWAGLPDRLIEDWLREWFRLWLLLPKLLIKSCPNYNGLTVITILNPVSPLVSFMFFKSTHLIKSLFILTCTHKV